MVIKFKYGNKEHHIKFDGNQFMPVDLSPVKNQKTGEITQGDRVEGYFKSFGNAVNWVIKQHLGAKEEEISLLSFVTQYELAVKQVTSLNPEDLEF